MGKLMIVVFAVVSVRAFSMTADEFAELKTKADGGDVEAMCEVGRCYRNGRGVVKNDDLASHWTRKAASNGLARAIGHCYEFGYGCGTNLQEAAKWYGKGTDKGDAMSMYDLGWCYANGVGVKKDGAEAAKWYQEARKAEECSSESKEREHKTLPIEVDVDI